MIMPPGFRKLALTAHITSSIGWVGAVAVFLVLAITGLRSQEVQLVRAVYLAMDVTTWFVIVPLAFAALLTGVASSLGTNWGLFRYYWVVVKLLITILSAIILLVHTQPIRLLAGVAATTTLFRADLYRLQVLMVIASGAGLLALLVVTVLPVYKPRGLTGYGWRKHQEQRIGLEP